MPYPIWLKNRGDARDPSDLAVRLERPQSFVSKYEMGDRRLDVLELRSICLALNTDLPRLVERLEAALPPP